MKKWTVLFKAARGCCWREPPRRAWDITFDTTAPHDKQTFGSGFGAKQTADSAGRQRTRTSVNTEPVAVRHRRLNLTWKEFPVLGAENCSKFHMLLADPGGSAHEDGLQRLDIGSGGPSCQSVRISRLIPQPAARKENLLQESGITHGPFCK